MSCRAFVVYCHILTCALVSEFASIRSMETKPKRTPVRAVALALCVSLLSSCTVAFGAAGGIIGSGRQLTAEEKKPVRDSQGVLVTPSEPMSVGGHIVVGTLAGMVADFIVMALIISDATKDLCFSANCE